MCYFHVDASTMSLSPCHFHVVASTLSLSGNSFPLTSSKPSINTPSVHLLRLRVGQYFVAKRQRGSNSIEGGNTNCKTNKLKLKSLLRV